MKTAVAYDRLNREAGAERVINSISKIVPESTIYTSVISNSSKRWTNKYNSIVYNKLLNIPYIRNKHEILGTIMPIVFEAYNFNEFDLVITITSEAAKGIITKPGTKHICYMLTPTRYLWSHHDEYFKNKLLWFFSRPAVCYLKHWDKIAAKRPDTIISISNTVKDRVNKYYGIDSKVIYPPVNTTFFKPSDIKKEDYYLLVGRMVPYKRADLAIKAFNKLGKKLIVVGKGGYEKYLKSIAGKNIYFTGYVSDEKLKNYYRKAKALIFPQEEDFGIVAVEAMACGTPVIAFNKGGATETVINNKTGILFDDQTIDSLVDAVKRFDRMDFRTKTIRESVKKFSEERFLREFKQIINND